MNNAPKYQYHVSTWGGFYNDEHKAIHGLDDGDFVFDTKQQREAFIERRKEISRKLNAHHLALSLSEGFTCDVRTVLHRVVTINGEQHYSTYDMGINYPFNVAMYHMENKWYPGFNDYPLGEDFDYDSADIKVLQEWITGAMTVNEDE